MFPLELMDTAVHVANDAPFADAGAHNARDSDAGAHNAREAPATLFVPGRNCYRVAKANRVSLLVDGDHYFRAFARAASRAQHSIVILAWDFDSRVRLHWDDDGSGAPATLGAFLEYLVKRRPQLHIYILNWDYPMVFGTDREFPPLYGLGWSPPRNVHLRYDNTHPVGGSHHQKIVVIDDALAFSGGLDLTCRRWDTCDHKADNPRRVANGDPYPPFHDLMAAVDGEAAQALAKIARERWKRATHKELPSVAGQSDPWPESLNIDMTDVMVAVSRTEPPRLEHNGIYEVEQLYLDMIGAARRYIYIENQYFTSKKLGAALAARLADQDGPEVIIVLRYLSHGWLEENTMHALRTRLIKELHAADRWHRCRILYPYVPDLKEGTCLDIHSKAMIVDDEWLRIGSANFCNRSMGMDTECDLTFEARGNAKVASVIADFRDRLLAEHLDVTPQSLRTESERAGSLSAAIASLAHEGRTLKEFGDLPEWPDVLLEVAAVADPERPVALDDLVKEFSPNLDTEKRRPLWHLVLAIAVFAAGLTVAWKFTPLAQLADPDLIINSARDFGGLPWAPLCVILAYTAACLVMFPRPLITMFAVVAFGTWAGFAYAMSGIVLAALATYAAGRMAGRATVRRMAGPRLNRVSEILRKRGLLAMTAVRLVPVAPFAVIGLVAGAIRIKIWQVALGTALGNLPGTLAATVFADQLEAALRDPSRINYALLCGVIAIFVVGILVIRRWLFGRGLKTDVSISPLSPRHTPGSNPPQHGHR